MVDTFAHAAVSYLVFRKTPKRRDVWFSVFFGIAPDLFSWTIYMLYNIFSGSFSNGPPLLNTIPPWMFTLYGITHSVIIFSSVALILYFVLKRIPVYIWAWLLHILIDIPTHSREFLPTPFLWPVSSWVFPGLSWGTEWFFIGYWILIISIFIGIVIRRKKEKITKQKHN